MGVATSPMACSGGRYWAVPMTMPAAVRFTWPVAREIPKSVSFTMPSGRTIMFAGLMSRCTTPARAAAPRAIATCTRIGMRYSGSMREPPRR